MNIGDRIVTPFGGRLHIFRSEGGRVFAGSVRFQPDRGRWYNPAYLTKVD